MRSAFVISALAALAAATPGGVSGSIAPTSAPPAGCQKSYSGPFGLTPTNISSDATSSKRSLKARDTPLTIMLTNGVLKDSEGRTGYIASNQQFQFDKPPQAGAIYTAGFTACSNGSLALGGDAIFYSCLTSNFYNLYFTSQGGQCFPVTLQIIPTSGSGSATTAAPGASGATSAASGATSAASAGCTEYSDGQPQCTTAAAPPPACSEYKDGQPQCATTAAPACSEYKDGQPQCATTAAPVCSEYSDGQPQCATTAAPPPPAECSEYSDGQPQCATTAAPPPPAPVCSEYSDGQPQCATTAAPAPVCSEYSDGQPQCATTAAPQPSAACSEYKDGQPQCSAVQSTAVVAQPSTISPPIATGAAVANTVGKEMFGLAAGIVALAML